MIYITLNAIRVLRPCASGWEKLLAHLGKTKADDEPLLLETVLDSNGLDDCLWCLRCIGPEHDGWIRHLARSYALDVIHLWDAPAVVREYLESGREDLRAATWAAAARDAARDAARAATRAAAALDAAWAAAWAAAAWDAAWAAAWDAAWAAARDAAWAAARDAARDAAAWDAARAAQADRLREYLRAGGRPTNEVVR